MLNFKLPFVILASTFILVLALSVTSVIPFNVQAQGQGQLPLGSFFGSTNTTIPDSTNLLTYDNLRYGLRLQYPGSWIYQEYNPTPDLTAYTVVSFYPPEDQNPGLASELRMKIENLNSPMTVDSYANDSINYYRNIHENFNLISLATTNKFLSGIPAYEMMFTDNSTGMEYKTFEKGTIDNVNNRVYYLTFRSPSSSFDRLFDPSVNNMIDSLQLATTSGPPPLNDAGDALGMFPGNSLSGLDQLPLTSGDLNSQDLELFIEGLSNSIFNGSSTFATIGTSVIDGIEVTGISIEDGNATEMSNDLGITNNINLSSPSSKRISVTLIGPPLTGSGDANSSVTVVAARLPIDIGGTLSSLSALDMASLSSSLRSDPSSSLFMGEDSNDLGSLSNSPFATSNGKGTETLNPFGFLPNMQIGSNSLVNPDWSIPQSVSMSLAGGGGGERRGSDSQSGTGLGNFSSSIEVVGVMVIPYTGTSNGG